MSIHPSEVPQHFGRSDNSRDRCDASDISKNANSQFASEYLSLQKNGNAAGMTQNAAASESLQNRGLLPGLQLTDCNNKSNMSFAPSDVDRSSSSRSISSSLSFGESGRSRADSSIQSMAQGGRIRDSHGASGALESKPGNDRSKEAQSQPGASPSRSELRGNEQKIMDYFMGKGLTRAQAAGIVGNIHQESGGDPNRRQMGGGPGYGLAQWEGSRKQDLARFAREQGKPISDLKTQLDFMYKELTSTESRAFRALKTATSPAQAADIFQRQYERASRPNTPNRIAHANRVFRSYGDSPTMIAER
ncbi:MAG: hypothetical protein IPP57_03090 [Candidatus Obscuribacter sp.]|nr:hypothetical protein [Candidatus Obscuribacter sp.]